MHRIAAEYLTPFLYSQSFRRSLDYGRCAPYLGMTPRALRMTPRALGMNSVKRRPRTGLGVDKKIALWLYNHMVNTGGLDAVFGALSDPTRRRIVERLARHPMTVGEIAAGFTISQPGISKHVRILEEAGLLKREIDGRVHRCRLDPNAMAAASSWIDKQREFWNSTFDRLDAYLARTSNTSKRKKQ